MFSKVNINMVHTLQFLKRFVYKLICFVLYLPSVLSILITNKNTTPKINIFPISHPFLFLSLPFSSIFIPFISPFLSLPLSDLATSIPHVLHYLSLLIAHSTPSSSPPIQYLFSLSFFPHHFSFFCPLSPQVLRNLLCHTPLILAVVFGFFDSFPSFLSVCVFVFFTQLIFLLLSIFPLLRSHTRFSDNIFLSPSSPCFFFSLQHSVSILHSSLPSILFSIFASLFPTFTLSLFLLHSSLTM
jgi:hypothetical protein